jgi:GNAT superfamily N-acetyltransferase
MEIKNYTDKAQSFFKMLPKDWQENIIPFWDELKASTQVYVLMDNGALVAGGLLFSKCPPDMLYYKKEADKWFKKGYIYLGFIYVDETKRNQNLGSLWLDKVKELYPNNGFWLSIEDEKLHKFYTRNQFEKIATVKNQDSLEESIYIFNP